MGNEIVRVHHHGLSTWQSVVADYVKVNYHPVTRSVESKTAFLSHDMVQGTNTFVTKHYNGESGQLKDAAASGGILQKIAHISKLAYEMAEAKLRQDLPFVNSILTGEEWRRYTDNDVAGFLSCVESYVYWFMRYANTFRYNDWQLEGRGNINYGVIDYKLKNDAKIGIIGDWGTGLHDAYALLNDMVVHKKVDAIIHLGDIYYSCSPDHISREGESQTNFVSLFQDLFTTTGKPLPVFSIPGNHDYYSFGWGFHEMLGKMNSLSQGIKGAYQEASYFCLRSEDNGWQFLGMDTGYYDANPANQADAFLPAPGLKLSELLWHIDKLENFPGNTVLLSHHQLFSSAGALNGSKSAFADYPYYNTFLYNSFASFFNSKVAAWLWGHEHNFILFQNDLLDLAKGRLIGASAYEELQIAEPYKNLYPKKIAFLDKEKYRLSVTHEYYNHSYAVIDLGGRSQPTDPVNITYYEYPSWGDSKPPVNAGSLIGTTMYQESFVKPKGERWRLGFDFPFFMAMYTKMVADHGVQFKYIGRRVEKGNDKYKFPTLNTTSGVQLALKAANGQQGWVKHNDIVFIQSLYEDLGNQNFLGAWEHEHNLYYWDNVFDKNKVSWRVVKQNNSTDPYINFGDIVCFQNQFFKDQWITMSDISPELLTTKAGDPGKANFIIMRNFLPYPY